MAINKKSFLDSIKKGVGAVADSITEPYSEMLSARSRFESSQRARAADLKGTNLYTSKIPKGIPKSVASKAKKDIAAFVKAGNYAGVRKYITGLKPSKIKKLKFKKKLIKK